MHKAQVSPVRAWSNAALQGGDVQRALCIAPGSMQRSKTKVHSAPEMTTMCAVHMLFGACWQHMLFWARSQLLGFPMLFGVWRDFIPHQEQHSGHRDESSVFLFVDTLA